VETPLVEQVRRFNRAMTERIGALNDHFLGRNLSLGEARLLWEIGEGEASVRSLRRRLGLDSAYVSRLLRSLERHGFIVVEASPDDGRVRQVRLTEHGRRERAELDERSNAFARSLVEPLSGREREKLAAAMADVERILTVSMVQIAAADPTSSDARWCFEQYYAELADRFEAGFDSSVTLPVRAPELTPPNGLLLIARLREEPVGCGALKLHETFPAEIKRLWVAKGARGLGLGRRLLQELERSARESGVAVLHLDTNRALVEAIRLYRQCGYQEVAAFNDEPYAHYWFEKQL
jgi:DNA-binding MarR family transcriptional regulator/GNAT superfamily N-acetyltransferase